MASPFGFLLPPLPPLVPPDLPMQTISTSQLAYTFPAASIGSTIAVFLLPGQTLPEGSAAALYIQFPTPAPSPPQPSPSSSSSIFTNGQQPAPTPAPASGEFRFLGALGQGKSSAVFRVAGLKGGGSGANGAGGSNGATYGGEVDMDADETQPPTGTGAAAVEGVVTIGVSLEPEAEVAAKVAAQKAAQTGGGGADSTALVRRSAVSAQGAGMGTGTGTGTGGGGAGAQPSTKVLAQRIIKNAFNFLASFEGGTGMVPIMAFEGWWQKFERKVENDPGFLERDQD